MLYETQPPTQPQRRNRVKRLRLIIETEAQPEAQIADDEIPDGTRANNSLRCLCLGPIRKMEFVAVEYSENTLAFHYSGLLTPTFVGSPIFVLI